MPEVAPPGMTWECIKCLEVGCHVSSSSGKYHQTLILISREGFVKEKKTQLIILSACSMLDRAQ